MLCKGSVTVTRRTFALLLWLAFLGLFHGLTVTIDWIVT